MKYLSCFLILFLMTLNAKVLAQSNTESDPDQLTVPEDMYTYPSEDQEVEKQEKKLETGLDVGTSFMVSPGNFYGPSVYVAPNLTYNFSPRFRVSAGIMASQSTFYPTNGAPSDNILPMTRAFLYARGAYDLTPRLTIFGTAYKSLNDVTNNSENSLPLYYGYGYGYNYNYNGFDMGMDYKISDSFSIGFQIRMNSGNMPHYNGLIPPDAYVPVPGF